MAIHHFGQLLMDMRQYTWMLNDVVYAGLVPLILFLEDTEERVVKVSPEILEAQAVQRVLSEVRSNDETDKKEILDPQLIQV